MKKILMSCALALFCVTQVHAAPRQVASNGVFVTGDAGYGVLLTPSSNLNQTGGSYDRNAFGWSAGIGYNWAMDSFNMVGIEADYFDFGQSTYNADSNSGSLKVTSAAEAILFSYTTLWSNGVNLFFKVGPAYVQQKNDFTSTTFVNGGFVSGSGTKNNLTGVGVIGLGFYVAKNLNLFVDVTGLYGHDDSNWDGYYPSNGPGGLSAAGAVQGKVGFSYQF